VKTIVSYSTEMRVIRRSTQLMNSADLNFRFTEFYEVRPLGVTESSGDVSSRSYGNFPRIRRIPMLFLCFVVLAAIFFIVGCTDGSSQAGQEGHASHSDNVKLALLPEHDSGVSGTASFEEIAEGVLVKLKLRGLPKPNAFYLAYIHPGTCAQEAEEGEPHEHDEHGKEGHEHGGGIEYPLSQVKSDSGGHGSSTTTLGETSVDKLFSGEPKYVNVHEAGSGNPPILSCADLKRAG
jgi:hypothetical protein